MTMRAQHPTEAPGPPTGPRAHARHVSSLPTVLSPGTGGAVFGTPLLACTIPHPPALQVQMPKIVPAPAASMSGERSGQRQCRRGVTGDVELDAAMALADMAGVPSSSSAAHQQEHTRGEEEEDLASTRLSVELGKVGIQASSCSSSSSAGCPSHAQQQAAPRVQAAAAPSPGGYGPRPRHALTEAEKEAKRLRRVLANRESARQTILRRQAIRDELARKVAELASQNESMKKEKETVVQEYLTLQETNKQLKEQVVAMTAGKASSDPEPAPVAMPMDTTPPPEQRAETMPSRASPLDAPPGRSFMYAAAAPPAVPAPYVWGSWPGYDPHGNQLGGAGAGHAPPLGFPPCAWYYPVAADAQPVHEVASRGGSPGTVGDDDPCSLTLGLDVTSSESAAASDRERAADARRRRKELTKLKQTQLGGRPGDE